MGDKFLGFMEGKSFYIGTRVKLHNPNAFGGIVTATIHDVDRNQKVVILKRFKADNGEHIDKEFKNVKYIYVSAEDIDIIKQPKLVEEDNFKIWF